VTEAIVEGAVLVLGVGQEREITLRQPDHRRRRIRLPAGDHQAPRDVVRTVAVLPPRDGVPGMFEHPGVIGQSNQVREGRHRRHRSIHR
jgi:hypothetical protein